MINDNEMNVVKDVTFEGAILQQVRSTIDYLETQVREHSFLGDAFILKATLMAEWTSENEFDRPSAAQVPPKYRPSTAQKDGMVNVRINIANLTERQREIYEIIKNGTINGTVNAQNLSVALDISLRTTKRDLYVLRDMNLIQYVGSDKTGHWEVKKENDI